MTVPRLARFPHAAARPWLPWLLVAPVAVLHLLLGERWLQDQIGWGAGNMRPARLEVAFVRELQPAPPSARPLAMPAPARPRSRPIAAPPEPPASAALAATAEPPPAPTTDPMPAIATATPEPAPAAPQPAMAPVDAEIATAAPVAQRAESAPDSRTASTFEWPPSTELSYTLTGNYQGPVQGQASVQWRMVGQRYQVQLELSIGPFFAPLVTRELQSDGIVTAQGLQPLRYDEETRVAFHSPRRLSVLFDEDNVRLPSGLEIARPAGVQDSASQFVQMTWLFTTQPERLRVGGSVEVPLALPRHVETWTYDIVSEQSLDTPMGPLPTVLVRPRRPQRPGNDLVAEFWVAPSLQYLPVRFVIRQDEKTYVDLMLSRGPRQAEPPTRMPR